jgi:hypothetical protein
VALHAPLSVDLFAGNFHLLDRKEPIVNYRLTLLFSLSLLPMSLQAQTYKVFTAHPVSHIKSKAVLTADVLGHEAKLVLPGEFSQLDTHDLSDGGFGSQEMSEKQMTDLACGRTITSLPDFQSPRWLFDRDAVLVVGPMDPNTLHWRMPRGTLTTTSVTGVHFSYDCRGEGPCSKTISCP